MHETHALPVHETVTSIKQSTSQKVHTGWLTTEGGGGGPYGFLFP